MTLAIGDYVKWNIPEAGTYPDRYGDRVMVIRQLTSEFAYLDYEDTGAEVGNESGFYHHRFNKIPKFLILSDRAIKSKSKKKEKHGKKQTHPDRS